jgi:hypothetical protein
VQYRDSQLVAIQRLIPIGQLPRIPIRAYAAAITLAAKALTKAPVIK